MSECKKELDYQKELNKHLMEVFMEFLKFVLAREGTESEKDVEP